MEIALLMQAQQVKWSDSFGDCADDCTGQDRPGYTETVCLHVCQCTCKRHCYRNIEFVPEQHKVYVVNRCK